MKRAVVFLALLASSLPATPQQLAAVGPVQTAQANPSPEPVPQPPQAPPPKKPATAAPGEDTGMAGQVAQTEGVVLPAAGAVSATAVFGILGLALAGVALSGNSDDDTPAATTTTGTR
jgi:hypothetical protein